MTERRRTLAKEAADKEEAAQASGEATLSVAEGRLSQAWAGQKDGTQAVLDPATIQLLIELGLGVVKMCMGSGATPAAVVQRAQNPGLLRRLQVRMAVQKQLNEVYGPGSFGKLNGPKLVETLIKAAATSTGQEVSDFAAVQI